MGKASSLPPTASSTAPPHKRTEYLEDVFLDGRGTDQRVGIAEQMLVFGQTVFDELVVHRVAVPNFEETFPGPHIAGSNRAVGFEFFVLRLCKLELPEDLAYSVPSTYKLM